MSLHKFPHRVSAHRARIESERRPREYPSRVVKVSAVALWVGMAWVWVHMMAHGFMLAGY